MTKQAYIVSGPESSGNRYLAKLCIQAGCKGNASTIQRFDSVPPVEQDKIVWIRSLPHAGRLPDLAGLVVYLRKHGYLVRALVPVRCPIATQRSQVYHKHVHTVHQAQMHREHGLAFALGEYFRLEVPCLVLSLEGLILHPVTIGAIFAQIGLTLPEEFELPRDENAKWYGNLS